MSEPKNQHIIPRVYLKQFVDPKTPLGHEPYVWVFERDSKRGKKRAPKNILAETDFYTISIENGEKNYVIEKSLAQIEGRYAAVFEEKIKKKIPLDDEEHIYLCAFVAAMLQRTLKQKENIEGFMDQLIEKVEAMEQANGIPPGESLELKKERENAHQKSVAQMIPEITRILIKMNVAFLCTKAPHEFITSDSPAFLFNYKLQWQRFYGPGLDQKHVELRMPLSPEIAVSFSWINNLRGYLGISPDLVHEINRMGFGRSHQYFIANSPKLKRRWFSRFPLDPIFIFRILRYELTLKWHDLMCRYQQYVRKRRL